MKKIISAILSVSILLSMGTATFAANNDDEFIDAVTAQGIATNFAIARAQAEDTEESFPLPFKVVLDETMYDFDGNVSAYKFDVVNIDEMYSGYIITGAQTEYAPIIEYSTSGTESFIDSAKAEISENEDALKVYYNGGFDYFIESTETDSVGVYDASSVSKVSQTVATLAENGQLNNLATNANTLLVGDQQMETAWNNTLAQVMSSNPPTSGFISDPLDYETGYSGYTMSYIKEATWQPYITDGSAPYSEHENSCGAIASVNLFIYHYGVNDKTALKYNGDWGDTYEEIRRLVGHQDGCYIYVDDLTDALNDFCDDRGYTNSNIYLTLSPSVNHMISAVTNNRPQIILVNGHYTYGDHYMLTLGRETYNYSNGQSTTYFRVADGWSTSNRYIYYDPEVFVSVINATIA